MPPLSQIATYMLFGVKGAIQIIKLDPQGLTYFGNTSRDFWNSFLGAFLLGPVFILYLIIRHSISPPDGSFSIFLVAQIFAYSITWLAFPLVMLYLAPILQRSNQIVHYLVAYNWVSVIQNGVYLPVVILGITGVFSDAVTNFLAITVLMWVLGLSLFLVRLALKVSLVTGVGVVIMDLLLSLLIEVLTNRAY